MSMAASIFYLLTALFRFFSCLISGDSSSTRAVNCVGFHKHRAFRLKENDMSLFGELGTRKELENKAKTEGRLPPGQSLTLKWPVLHYGSIPQFDPAKWDFKISGELDEPKRLSWSDFR